MEKLKLSVFVVALLLGTLLTSAIPVAADGSATLTVSFPGVTVGNVWVRQAGTNTDVIPPLGPQTDSATTGVPYGTYDVWVQQGSGSYEKVFNVDCSGGGTCTAAYSIANLTVNFSGVTVGNVLVRVPGTNSDIIPWSGARTDLYGPVKLLADTYDVWAQQGNGKWEIISVDCTGGGACTATYAIANLTVNFTGVTVGNVWIRQSGGTNNDVVTPLGSKTGSAGPVNLLADTYDVWVQQGSGAYEKKLNVNCSVGGACSADFTVKTLTVGFTGVTVSNVWVRKPDTNSDVVTPLGSRLGHSQRLGRHLRCVGTARERRVRKEAEC
jgi:hypothetical protein